MGNLFANISKIAKDEVPVVTEIEIKKSIKVEEIKKEEQEEKVVPEIETKIEVKKEAKKQFGNLFASISKIANSEGLAETKPERKEAPVKEEVEVLEPSSAPAATEDLAQQ
jgi:hypothetical protein